MPQRWSLYCGIKALLTCDSSTVVSGIVGFVVSERRAVRVLAVAMERFGWLASAIILLNAIRCFAGVHLAGRGDTIVVARRPNERKAVEALKRTTPGAQYAELAIEWRLRPVLHALAALLDSPLRDARRTARLTRLLIRRYGVFRALRVVELIAFYRRYSQLLASRFFRVAVMSSHSNPHGIALNLVARRFEVPIVLVTHGMPILPIARLDYDVAIHECEASAQVYRDAGCRMGHVVIKSRRQDYLPMSVPVPSGLTIGVFLSKDPVAARVVECVRALAQDASVRQVIVRPHPVNLWRGLERTMASLDDPRIGVQSSGLACDLERCDAIVGGNSTVLLDAVVAGRPACYVSGLDHGPYDVQEFVQSGLVAEWRPSRPLDWGALARFYPRSGWSAVLRRYADVDCDEHQMAADVRAAIDAATATGIRAVA